MLTAALSYIKVRYDAISEDYVAQDNNYVKISRYDKLEHIKRANVCVPENTIVINCNKKSLL
jgi:hypothetical protein